MTLLQTANRMERVKRTDVDEAVSAWQSGGDAMFEFCIHASEIVGQRLEGKTKDLGRRIKRSPDTVERYAKVGLLWYAMLQKYPIDSEWMRDAYDWQWWMALAPLWTKNIVSLAGVRHWFTEAKENKWDYEKFLSLLPKAQNIDGEWQKTALKTAALIDDLLNSPAFGVDELKYKAGLKLLKMASSWLKGMTHMSIIEKLIEEKIAVNVFQSAHIANGLKLSDLKTEEEQVKRAKLYRDWRNAGEPSKVAYQKAIAGDKVEALIDEALHSEGMVVDGMDQYGSLE